MIELARRGAGLGLGLALALVGSGTAMAAGPPGANPDGRAYEMVSPPDKGGFPIDVRGVTKSTADGDDVAYQATGAFAGAESSLMGGYYVARRDGQTGWSVRSVTAPQYTSVGSVFYSDRAISDDLETVMQFSFESLAPGATRGGSNLYRFEPFTGHRTLLATGASRQLVSEITKYSPQVTGVSGNSDLSQFAFASETPLLPGAPSTRQVYQVSDGELRLVSRLPDGSLPSTANIGKNSDVMDRNSSVSADGRRVYFHAVGGTGGPYDEGLYLRVNDTTTVPVSVSRIPGDPDTMRAARFIGASDDGTVAYFTSTARLTEDAEEGLGLGGLYRYDGIADSLTPVTPRIPTDGSLDAYLNVRAYNVSSDGSSVYFMSASKLTPDASVNTAQIYHYEHGVGVTLVGPIVEDISLYWARATDDGRFFAFSTHSRPTGFDNADPYCKEQVDIKGVPAGACYEVFVYDAAANKLACASCAHDQGGNGHSTLMPQFRWISDYKPRSMLSDGTVVFTSEESLVPEDVNGKRDVYQWRKGVAALISSGRDHRDSYFAEASADGSNVFFVTSERLLARDVDEERDLYVARVGGGIAAQDVEPAKDPVCEGDSCQGELDSGPGVSSIGSLGLAGSGDVARPVAVRARVGLVRGSVRGGSFSVRVRASGRGRFVVSGSGLRSKSRNVSAGQSSRLRLSLKRSARRKLAQRGRLRVNARVLFTAASGQRSVSRVYVTLRSVDGAKAGSR